MNLFRPTCRPTAFEADLSGQVLIPNAVNYLRRNPAGTLDAYTREMLRRELTGWLAEYDRMAETLEPEDLKRYHATVAEVLAKVEGALARLDGSGATEDPGSREASRPEDAERLESTGHAPRTLAS